MRPANARFSAVLALAALSSASATACGETLLENNFDRCVLNDAYVTIFCL